jgi:hypothetical protein
MLGFSQYSQVSYVAIIEQKIRVFLLSVFTVSPRLAGLMQGALNSSGTLQSAVVDSLFALLVQSLKDKNLYEEYLIPSVFIEEINYDFVTNEDSRSLEIAEKNFKDTFFRVLKETLSATQIEATEQDASPSSAFLTALLIAGKIRPVVSYTNFKSGFFLEPSTSLLPLEIGKPISSLFQGDVEFDENVFYLETFYRVRDDVAVNLTEDEIKVGQFLSRTELDDYLKENKLEGSNSSNFVKGIRLMMNLTSLVSILGPVPQVSLSSNLPAFNKESLQNLPFLNTNFINYLGNTVNFKSEGRNYYSIPKGGYLFDGIPGGPNFGQKIVTADQVRKSLNQALTAISEGSIDASVFLTDGSDDPVSFRASKAFVSAEETSQSYNVYFPISMSEFVSQDFKPTDVELANGLASTTTFNEFFVTTNTLEIIQIITTLVRFFSINPIEFFDAAENSAIKSQNEALDNMIINLINFDEV